MPYQKQPKHPQVVSVWVSPLFRSRLSSNLSQNIDVYLLFYVNIGFLEILLDILRRILEY